MKKTTREPPRRHTDFAGLRLLRKTPRELRRKSEWACAIVRSDHEVGHGSDRMPAGTFWLVRRNYGGLELQSFPCRCCGKQSFVGPVPEDDVTYIGQLPEGSGGWHDRHRAGEAARRTPLNGCACEAAAERCAVERIRDRVAAAVDQRRPSEHTVVIGADADARRRVLDAAAIESAGAGALVARLSGAEVSPTGANAVWRAAADRTGPPADDEDVAPLPRLLDLDATGAECVAVCIDDFDELIGRWKDRDEAWSLRHTLQNESRIVLVATCAKFPPPGTTAADSGAWGSFAVADIGKNA